MLTNRFLLFPAALGKWPTISKPHWANSEGLERGLRTPPSWWMFGTNLWHWSHFLTYSWASFCIPGHQYPWWWFCETEIFLLCDSHKLFCATPRAITLILHDVYIANTAQNRSACTICNPRTARTKELFFVFSWLLISLQVVYHL